MSANRGPPRASVRAQTDSSSASSYGRLPRSCSRRCGLDTGSARTRLELTWAVL